MTLNQQVNLGIEASQVLESEAFKQAMNGLRTQVIEQWKACPIRDKEGQTLLLQLAKMTDKFEGLMYGAIARGEYAKRQIQDAVDAVRDENPARRFFRRVA